jgi:hypothetical protein
MTRYPARVKKSSIIFSHWSSSGTGNIPPFLSFREDVWNIRECTKIFHRDTKSRMPGFVWF